MNQQNEAMPETVHQPRTYSRPLVRHYGDIRELTQASGGMGIMDGAMGMNDKTSA